MEYCGTIRISKPETLQNWIDRGWYQKTLSRGYIFNVGCGRFKTEKCVCSACRTKTRPELTKIVNKFNSLNINNMEKGLNFGQAIEAAKAGKRVARAGWNGAGMFAYIVPESQYPAITSVAKKYWGEGNFVPYRAYWALKTAQEDVATWAPSGSDSLAEDWTILD